MIFTIYGDPKPKKNGMNVGRNKYTGQTFVVQNKNYKKFRDDCIKQIGRAYKQEIDYPVNVRYTFYREKRLRVDGNNLTAAMDDILVEAGVLKDDNRDIVASHDGTLVLYNKDNPRTEIVIEPIERYYIGYEPWKKEKKK